jgi:hypothetical protein
MNLMTYEEAAQKVAGLTDGLGKGIDKGIEETIIVLLRHGFTTRQSCEGHLDWGLAVPWVDLEAPPSEEYSKLSKQASEARALIKQARETGAKPDFAASHAISRQLHQLFLPDLRRLIDYVVDFNQSRPVTAHCLLLNGMGGDTRVRLMPQNGVLRPADDSAERKLILRQGQREMKDFTSYLEQLL